MSNIEQIISEWKVDSRVDETRLPNEISRTPLIHSKYLELYIFFKARLAAAEKKYNVMKFTKRKYYRGECTQQELQQYGWPQWQGLKPSGTELNQLFDMDSDLNDLQEKVEYFKTSVSTLEYIMKAIQSRDWQLKTLFEVQRYMNG